MASPEPLLDQNWLAERLGTTIKMLEQRRYRGDFVPFIKIGRLVRYRLSDVERWIEDNVKTMTPHAARFPRKKISKRK